jgi:nucleoside-diphosphate-sugar epimerase
LVSRGHTVRGTTRSPARAPEIRAAGAEPVIADPDRIATVMPALDNVAVVCLLLGSAQGHPEQLEALHGPRLEMLLARLIDTTVRGVVYEARGSVPERVLAAGSERVRRVCGHSHVPFELLETRRDDGEAWLAAALTGVERLIS